MSSERTLLLIKPEAVRRNLNFQIADRFEKRSFALVACKMLEPSKALAEEHYASCKGSAGFAAAVEALTAGPVVAMLFEAPGAIAVAASMLGDADPAKAEVGTIRGDFAISAASNLVESSSNAADAKRTAALWFTPAELAVAAPPPAAATATPQKAEAANGAAADGAEAGEGGEGGKSKRALAKEAKKAAKAEKKDANKKQSAGIPVAPADDKPKSARRHRRRAASASASASAHCPASPSHAPMRPLPTRRGPRIPIQWARFAER